MHKICKRIYFLQTAFILGRNGDHFVDVTEVQRLLLVIFVAVVPIMLLTIFTHANTSTLRITNRITTCQIRKKKQITFCKKETKLPSMEKDMGAYSSYLNKLKESTFLLL